MNYKLEEFKDNEGIVLAKALIPEDYSSSGVIRYTWQHDTAPFRATIQARNKNNTIILHSSSREMYEVLTNPMFQKFLENDPNAIKESMVPFTDIETYLRSVAERICGNRVTPVSMSKLPTAYYNNLDKAKAIYQNYFYSHVIDINCKNEISNICTDSIMIKYKTTISNQDVYFVVGCDFKGIEYYDAIRNSMNIFGMFNKKTVSDAPFGYSKNAGKPVDAIQWGAERIYAVMYKEELEQEAMEVFLRFASSVVPDEKLEAAAENLVMQRRNQMMMVAQGLANQAHQMQMQSMALQQQVSRNIAQMQASTSAGIMDSWDKKMASETRISNNFSEAIRGVNTYTDNYGHSYEASVVNDHVYKNQYGDIIGVSGNAPDNDLLSKLNWTELNKK